MGTRGEWSKAFLNALGNTSPSEQVVNLVSAWTKGENTGARYNPLATKLDYGTTTDFNSVGVKNYQSQQQGIEATVMSLKGASAATANNAVIRQALASNDAAKALDAMMRSSWGTNFNTVRAYYLNSDVRGEPLKATESGANGSHSGSVPTGGTLPSGAGTPHGYTDPNYVPDAAASTAISGDDVYRVSKIAFGISLVSVGVILLIYAGITSKPATDVAKVAAKVLI